MLALAWERGWHAGAGVPRQRDYQAGIRINPADAGGSAIPAACRAAALTAYRPSALCSSVTVGSGASAGRCGLTDALNHRSHCSRVSQTSVTSPRRS